MGLHGRVAVRALCAEHAGRDVCSPFPATVVGASGAVCVTVQGFVRAFEAIGHTRLARTHRLWGEPASGPTAFAELVVLLGPADAISGSGHDGTFARD